MKVININSKICLSDYQIDFIKDVIIKGDRAYDRYCFRKESFEKESKRLEIKQEKGEFPAIELLGFYTRESRSLFEESPIIVICLERIRKYANDEKKFLYLTTLVILHELVHAYMDVENKNKLIKRDLFFQWMEESLANAFALRIIEEYYEVYSREMRWQMECEFILDKEIEDFAKNFVKHQPPCYALGYEVYKNHLDRYARWWGKYKEKVDSKDKEKQDWLDYVMNSYKNVDYEKLDKLYERLFDD